MQVLAKLPNLSGSMSKYHQTYDLFTVVAKNDFIPYFIHYSSFIFTRLDNSHTVQCCNCDERWETLTVTEKHTFTMKQQRRLLPDCLVKFDLTTYNRSRFSLFIAIIIVYTVQSSTNCSIFLLLTQTNRVLCFRF